MARTWIAASLIALTFLSGTLGAQAAQNDDAAKTGKASAAARKEAGKTAAKQSPVTADGLPTKIGIISIPNIFDHSKRMTSIRIALESTTDPAELNKIRQEQLRPQLNGLKDVVALYAKQNGYPIILEKGAFDIYLKTGNVGNESLGYYDERYVDAFIAKLRSPEGKQYAQQLQPQNLDEAIIPLFQ